MRNVLCPLPMWKLRQELNRLPLERVPDESGAARGNDTRKGWIHGLSMVRVPIAHLGAHSGIALAVSHLLHVVQRPVQQLMVNRLDAHSSLEKHRDGASDLERWHLPVFTHPKVRWWDETGNDLHLCESYWWGPLPFANVLHSMTNDSPIERLHIIADL